MSNSIRLYFNHFSVNQEFSPLPYEQKATRKKLLMWADNLRSQLVNAPRFRSKDYPIMVYVKYYVSKGFFETNDFLIKTYWLLRVLEQMTIIQASNNKFLDGVAYDVEQVRRVEDEGCSIVFIKSTEQKSD